MKFWNKGIRIFLVVLLVFGLFPDPFLWMIDEFIAWSALIILTGVTVFNRHHVNEEKMDRDYKYLYDKTH